MDSNMSDLLGSVLSNPEMMNKVKTLLPVVTQMMKTDNEPTPVQQQAPLINQQNQSQANQTDNIMANANVAAAIQNLIDAINQASNAGSDTTNTTPEKTNVTPPNLQDAIPALAQMLQPSASSAPADTLNIEKTLDTLKNVTAVASPENDHRAKLLLSLKPFMGESRRTKIDTAIKYINAAKIFSMFGKNGFV